MVLLFRSDCPACQVTEPTWRSLLSTIPSGIAVNAITPEPRGHDARFLSDPRVRVWHSVGKGGIFDLMSAPVVPVTILVDAGGVITYARVGALTP